jgi:hypothetical protein
MRPIALILLLVAIGCTPSPAPEAVADPAISEARDLLINPRSTCFSQCDSSIQCGGIVQLCRFCNFGECKSTRPESRAVDAGVDALPGDL